MDVVLEATGLTKTYAGGEGVRGIDLAVAPGEVFGFLGPNGAGKTTTIRLALGLLAPTAGTVRLFGEDPRRAASRARVGYLPGDLALDPRLTGRRTIDYFARLGSARDAQGAAALCERLELGAHDLARPVRDYSRGMRQKLGLVLACAGDPDLLVLDEPTTGLDPLVRETVLELMAEAGRRGRTVFHSSHVLSEIERVCTRVGILRAGRLVATERIDVLRARVARRMVVRFEGAVPRLDVPGIEVVGTLEDGVVLRVSGRIEPLLAELARHSVRHLAFPEPTLEDAFVTYYDESGVRT